MKGIDISAWQDNIDWQAIVDAGIEFVIIKLGQNNRLDDMFIEHINAAVEHGLKVGVYYYAKATSQEEAQAEAAFVDSMIKEYLNGVNPEMGIWYDMEDASIVDSGADITALCQKFTDQLKEAGYSYVGIYSSHNWLTNGYIDADALDSPIWVAQYNSECDFQHPNLKLWQYTDHVSDDLPYDGNEYFD